MGSASGEREDQYYRELLARVDNAIVETREPSSGGFSVEDCCKGCISKTVSGLLVVAAVVTECCVTLRMTLSRSGAESVQTEPPSEELRGGDLNFETFLSAIRMACLVYYFNDRFL